MQPIDALTDIDKKTIQSYIYAIGHADSAPIEQVLRVWNANKKTLFRAFGNKLSISKEINIEKNRTNIIRELSSIYSPYIIWYDSDRIYAELHPERLKEHCKDEFIASIIHYWAKKNYDVTDLFYITRIFCHENLLKGYITHLESDRPYKCKSFNCTIKNGMRTIRTLQKVIKATGYPNIDLFEQWCNKVNYVNTNASFKTKLVLSINPIDFMSMSDNECNWRSCMSWKNSGCYCAGTLEMMNSNVAIVAYLEGPKTFSVLGIDEKEYTVPNKTWRSLFYIHKKILLAGKSYPYQNKEISIMVLDWLRELVKKNLNWDYQFINQPYKDMHYLEGNFYLRDFFDVDFDKKKKHHCIFVYTNGMYNDIIEAHDEYICCRNYVDHSLKLCLSGPATCICCGDIIITREDIYSYDDLGERLICSRCKRYNKCSVCGTVHYYLPYKTKWGNFCSINCMKDVKYYPSLNLAINENNLYNPEASCIIMTGEDLNATEIRLIIDRFKAYGQYNQTIFDFMKWCRTTYQSRIKVYRIKKYLLDRYSNENGISVKLADFHVDPYYTTRNVLYGFTLPDNIAQIQKILQDIENPISLAQHFEKGGYSLCD